MDNTSVKIASLELENVKRIKAVRLVPTEKGLTVIGGNNGQGKTSVLDAIAWALGGDRYRPSSPERDGSVVPPRIRIVLNNGPCGGARREKFRFEGHRPHGAPGRPSSCSTASWRSWR